MAPSATTTEEQATETFSPTLGLKLPENAKQRIEKAGIDSFAYPTRPRKPDFLDEVYAIRSEYRSESLIQHYSSPFSLL